MNYSLILPWFKTLDFFDWLRLYLLWQLQRQLTSVLTINKHFIKSWQKLHMTFVESQVGVSLIKL